MRLANFADLSTTSPPSVGGARVFLGASLCAVLGFGAACEGPIVIEPDAGTVDAGTEPDGFDDHTVPFISNTAEYFARASDESALAAMKFVVTEFPNAARRRMRLYDNNFYTLHDEWYWYRLVNGASVPGDSTAPVGGLSFETIADVYAWASDLSTLPLDLRFIGERLYSPRFYELGLQRDPRILGLGTVVHVDARTSPPVRDEIWAFELEYQDSPTHDELVVFFQLLEQTLPTVMSENMKWLVRSPVQETLALSMEAQTLDYHDRIMRYSELAVPGDVEVYAEGLTAGRVFLKRSGESLDGATSTDILILEDIPDVLPPGRGLVTAVPQTPLAHINVLARNRGIPNAYLGGVVDDPFIDQLSRVRAPVAVRAIAPNSLDILPMSDVDFATWRALTQTTVLTVDPVDLTNAPYALDLASLSLDDVDDLRPLIGGKASGFLALLAPQTVTIPDWPMAITARAFREHQAGIETDIEAALQVNEFRNDLRVRVLALEGESAYDDRFPSSTDQAHKATIKEEFSTGVGLGRLLDEGGLVNFFESTPLDANTLAILTSAIEEQFAPMSPSQGLRFRSSSTVEDIEGFNGAGLYTSNTGFMSPPNGDTRTLERAIKRTWSSYWGVEAFEERKLAGVAHLSGNMGLVVHARFDDDKERSNGVFTYTILPGDDVIGVLEMNAQVGALSVTNPPAGSQALPEVDLVSVMADGTMTITRVAESTEATPGEPILTDDALFDVTEQAKAVADAWLLNANGSLLSAQKARAVVLDYEYREMDVGWPTLANGNNFGVRNIIKQVRSLEPSILKIPAHLRGQPIPKDVMTRARRIERKICTGPDVEIAILETYTDPLIPPNLGHDKAPFSAFIAIDALTTVLSLEAGERASLVHLHLASADHPGMDAGGAWAFDASVRENYIASLGLSRIVVDETALTIHLEGPGENENAVYDGTFESCSVERLYASPEEFLLGLFDD